jgi:F-type H+-transporting ATPase subunit beta
VDVFEDFDFEVTVIVATQSVPPVSPVTVTGLLAAEEDKLVVHRARRVQRFLSQPFHVAEQFTGLKGVLVPIEETIKGFNMILEGKVDEYPEASFNLVGTIEDAIEKGKKLLAEAR